MADLNHYRFHSEWTVPSAYEKTYGVLKDLRTYPEWWPEVKSVIPIDQDRAAVLIMGLLPYSLEFLMEKEVDDPDKGILQASLSGDLDGFSSWEIRNSDHGCRLIYDQEVEVTKRLLQVFAPIARPLFKANHSLMMLRGERGLRSYLDPSTG